MYGLGNLAISSVNIAIYLQLMSVGVAETDTLGNPVVNREADGHVLFLELFVSSAELGLVAQAKRDMRQFDLVSSQPLSCRPNLEQCDFVMVASIVSKKNCGNGGNLHHYVHAQHFGIESA